MKDEMIPFPKAILSIFLSVLCISGTVFFILLYLHFYTEKKAIDPKYQVIALLQSNKSSDKIKNAHFAEILDLSVDKPINIYRFNTQIALKKLLSKQVFKEVSIKKILPGTIYIQYSLRKPIAFISDYSNTVIDEEGVLFPWKPFFTPKKLPEIVLGIKLEEENIDWGTKLTSDKITAALSLLEKVQKELNGENILLQRIDVSQLHSPSCGQRQIIMMLEDHVEKQLEGKEKFIIHPYILRLNVENIDENLKNFKTLRQYLLKKEIKSSENQENYRKSPTIIDFRISKLAYIK